MNVNFLAWVNLEIVLYPYASLASAAAFLSMYY